MVLTHTAVSRVGGRSSLRSSHGSADERHNSTQPTCVTNLPENSRNLIINRRIRFCRAIIDFSGDTSGGASRGFWAWVWDFADLLVRSSLCPFTSLFSPTSHATINIWVTNNVHICNSVAICSKVARSPSACMFSEMSLQFGLLYR